MLDVIFLPLLKPVRCRTINGQYNAEDKKKSSHPGYEMGVKNDLIRTRVHENLLLLGTKVAQLLSQNCHECAEKLLLLLLLYRHCCSVQSQASMSL